MNKHTPGPWKVGDYQHACPRAPHCTEPHGAPEVVAANGSGMMLAVAVGDCGHGHETAQANARLIAAAPALLAALEGVLRECVTIGGFPEKGKGRTAEQQDAYDAARAAIAQAEEGA